MFFTVDPDTITHVGVWQVLGVATLGALLSIGLARVLTRWVELPAQRWLRARAWGGVVDRRRFELLTSSLRTRRSTN